MTGKSSPCGWFEKARFGLFIHWGIFSLLGRGEQVLFRERLDSREYVTLASRFNPTKYDPDAWARAATDAGVWQAEKLDRMILRH